MEKVGIGNVFEINIMELAKKANSGSLNFDQIGERLIRTQGWLREMRDFKYESLLLGADLKKAVNLINDLVTHVEWLRTFDVGTQISPTPKEARDRFDTQTQRFFEDVYTNVLMRFLPFLREEHRRQVPDQIRIDEEVSRFVKIREGLEEELKNVREETQRIRSTAQDVGVAKGERAAVKMAKHFDDEVARYSTPANRWFMVAIGFYACIIFLLVFFGIKAYGSLNGLISSPDVSQAMVWSAVISKTFVLAIVATLWYGLSFVLKNYSINSHLTAVNRHRAAVARTLEDFIAAQPKENPRLSEMLQNSTDAMFKHTPVGFLTKGQSSSR